MICCWLVILPGVLTGEKTLESELEYSSSDNDSFPFSHFSD